MGKSFYLGTDHELYTGSAAFSAKISADPGAYGLLPSQSSAYASVNAAWAAAYEAVQDPATRTRGKVAAKNQARASLRRIASDVAKMIGGTSTVTAEQKIDLGLGVRATPTLIPPPGVRPIVSIVGVSGRVVGVRVRDGAASGRPRKPAGVAGANVYTFVGEAYPTDPAGWKFESATTRTKLDVLFPDSVPRGAQVWICATWFNPRAQAGPVSNPVMTYLQGGLSMAA